ncbi:MAG: hypothetical protein IJH94_00425, partial [Clostridia bacterium]|nr:hypothetical protein [Clostridia bacterium]
RDESDESQQFARVVSDGDKKVLEISNDKTNTGLGRMLDPSTEAPEGSYEINFRFKPVDPGDNVMLLDFSINSFNEKNSIAKHNMLYSNKGTMRMGHRTSSVDVPMTRVGEAEEVWYDVKCVVNNDGGYYSVELYKEGEFIARRGGINYDGEEKIGFLKLSGYGKTILVDDVSIRPCNPEMLIYEDDFDSYSEVKLPETMLTVGASVSEQQSRNGDSFFEGYTPWRALKTFGNRYDLVYDKLIVSQVVELGDDVTTTAQESTGLILMPLEGEFLTKESQAKRGRLKLTYKFRHFSQNGYASTVDIINDYRYSSKWDYPPQVAIQDKGLSRPAVAGLPYLRTNNTAVKINQSLWYEAEVIFDVINDEVTVIVREDATSSEIANFKHNTNWINPDSAPVFDKVKAINFRAMTGSSVYIDDVRLEYYISNPEITGSNIIIKDYKGDIVTDKKSVPAAIKSIELPFGSEMTEESTNPETVTLTDSDGNNLSYSPVYDKNSYTIIPNEFLNVGKEYILTVPASVANVFGLELGTDFSYSFTVTGEYPELMTLASSSVSDLENIENGSVLTAEIDYANSLDTPLESMPFIAYYGDDMMLATSSVKMSTVGVGETGKKTVSFTVPSADVLDLSRVDKVSICLWKGFKNSVPYCAQIDIEGGGEELVFDTAQAAEGTASKPVITCSYNDSVLNISGTADEDDSFVTVQLLYPGKTFDMGEGVDSKKADELVFYRAQTSVINGRYSLDIRFDGKGDTPSTIKAGYYPAAIYVGDKKMDKDSVYLGSYSDFEAVCNELNNAAASDDFAKFKNILNTKRAALNFNNELLGDAELGDEIRSYYTYVRNNPLNANQEIQNSEMFDTYILMEYLNAAKIDNTADDIDTLVIADDVKALCNKVLTTEEKEKYFTGLISRKALSDPAQLEKAIKEALILTASKYGNGSGELMDVLVACGSVIGITAPISAAACKELIGKTYGDVSTFKRAYDEYAAASGSSSGGGGGGGGG